MTPKYLFFCLFLSSGLSHSFAQENSVVGKKIQSVKVEMYGDQDRLPYEGHVFRVNIITTLADGQVIESLDLVNPQNKTDYLVEAEGARIFAKKIQTGSINTQWTCGACDGGYDTKVVIRVKRVEDDDWLVKQEFNVLCAQEDAEMQAAAKAKKDSLSKAEDPYSYVFRTETTPEQRYKIVKYRSVLSESEQKRTYKAVLTLEDAEEKEKLLKLWGED